MKNKNIFKVISLTLITMIIFSCNKVLDLSPISSYNAGSFYNTQKDFELAVIGIYDVSQGLMGRLIPSDLEGRSDNISALVLTGQDFALVSKFTDNAVTINIRDTWNMLWNMIDRCNAVIDKIDAGTFSDETRRSNLKGEAYFFRGYAYFQLGWMYGGVPLIDRQMGIAEIKTTARSTQAETFAFAAKDFIQAAQLLPEVWATAELGKATKYTAQGILARMYMFQKKFSDAKPLLQGIIGSGKYQMATSYADCFLDSKDNSPEHVFQIQYKTGNLGEGNPFVAFLTPTGMRTAFFPTGGGEGMEVSEDLYNSYESGDSRRDFTVLKGFTTVAGQFDNKTLYFIKYAHGKIPANNQDFDVNLPVLRYTDVKMMYAEALNEASYNPNGEAFAILNEVRARGGLSPRTSVQIPTQEAFRSAMLQERRIEFACEYLRWFDLIRTDKAMSVMNAWLATTKEGAGTFKMEAYRILFAIPQVELDVNRDTKYMWQNPGY
ncbi:MAG: RagB/SusD family nutrient uptake outer membrane protein [Bacteroidia bacterium]|nr:RagB/SusD family nutrient uptake outer membrane protein [Bacteroidia bacterium]